MLVPIDQDTIALSKRRMVIKLVFTLRETLGSKISQLLPTFEIRGAERICLVMEKVY